MQENEIYNYFTCASLQTEIQLLFNIYFFHICKHQQRNNMYAIL